MKILKSICIAFSMYSKIPVPIFSWDKEGMKYAMCFFPLIGAVIGLIFYLFFRLCDCIALGIILRSAVLFIIPLAVTGGIHMDGFIDTVDALSSYKSQEVKLEILKDSHIGAFAVIKTVIFSVVYFGLLSEITYKTILLVSISYIFSRAWSALSIVSFKCAKTSGLAAQFAENSSKKVIKVIMIILILILSSIMIYINFYGGIMMIVASVLVFFYYRYMSYKQFGGITGDLAGYFLEMCELSMLLAAVIFEKGSVIL